MVQPREVVNPVTGEMIILGASTANLNVEEFATYVQKCTILLQDELGIYLT